MSLKLISIFKSLIIVFLVSACISEPPAIREEVNPSLDIPETGGNPAPDEEANQLPQPVNFFQIGGTESLSNLNIFADHADSFLIRGNNIIETLAEITQVSQK